MTDVAKGEVESAQIEDRSTYTVKDMQFKFIEEVLRLNGEDTKGVEYFLKDIYTHNDYEVQSILVYMTYIKYNSYFIIVI